MTLLLLFNQTVTATPPTVVTVPAATATATGIGTLFVGGTEVNIRAQPPQATATANGTVPRIAIRTSPPRAVTSAAIAIGTVTDPPLLEIKLSVPAPAALASAEAIAPLIQTAGPAIVLTPPAASATASAIPPTRVGTGDATLLSAPSAQGSALAPIPRLAVSLLPVSAVGSAIASNTVIALAVRAAIARADAEASVTIVIVVGIPTGVIIGRIKIIERIKAELEIV